MALVTLSGTISAADLNTNFDDKLAQLFTNSKRTGKDFQFDVEHASFTSATSAHLLHLDFTPTAHLEVIALALTGWNPDATSRTVTCTLTAIASNEEAVSKYILDRTISVSVTMPSSGIAHATRSTFTSSTGDKLFLIPGITYRLTLANSAASAVDRAVGSLVCRTCWRAK
jgi:hypothetical protein